MTQRVPLGITVGTANSVAVVAGSDDVEGVAVTQPTVLRLGAGIDPVFGSRAGAADEHHGDVVLDGFVARVGDPVPIRAGDGSAHEPVELTATAIGCLAAQARSMTGVQEGAGTSLVVGHPPGWTPHTVDVLVRTMRDAGHEIVAVPEPVAAVRWAAAAHRLSGDTTVLVYDLGAGGLTLSVVRDAAMPAPALRTSDIACAEFDLLLMRYVLANTPRGNDIDPFDPALEGELTALRARCRKAKEELSTHTSTVVAVHLESGGCRVRVVRDEFEELLRPPLRASLGLIRDAVHRAGLTLGDLDRVLLTGGGAAIPLVAELISAELALPVTCAPEPGTTSARGAALFAAERAVNRDMAEAETIGFTVVGAEPAAPRPVSETDLPTLPVDDERRPRHRRRLAVVAAATMAIGALATGTLAFGTGSRPPAEPDQRLPPTVAESAETAESPSDTSNSTGAVADNGSGRDGAAGRQDDRSSPGSTIGASTVAVGNSQPAPGTTTPDSAVLGSPPTPAAPEPPAPGAPVPTPSSPAAQLPAPPPPTTDPQTPPRPGLPTGRLSDTLNDTVDTLGDTVGPVLRAPGQILEGSGG